MEGTESPILLAQDYHFALLPRMVKEARPDARVAIFWHIPWPNPEVFGICPWQRELIDGLAGRGPDRFSHPVALQQFSFDGRSRGGSAHGMGPLCGEPPGPRYARPPISRLAWLFQNTARTINDSRNTGEERAALCAELGIEASLLGVGVDRVDYTKGIIERFRGIERFLELNPGVSTAFYICADWRTQPHGYRALSTISGRSQR